jgi:sigma-B regulation protein RsbU (phosphoserine phosphatase)
MDKNGEEYFTIWYGVYHRQTRKLVYGSAGHPPAVLLASDQPQPEIKYLGDYNLPIGMFPDVEFETGTYTVEPGSSLYLFSDGVYEVKLKSGEIWGIDAFVDYLKTTPQDPYSVNQIWQDIQQLNGHQPLKDDFSLLKIQFNG